MGELSPARPLTTADAEAGSVARGAALVMLAAVSWGTTGTTSRLLASHAHADPLVVGFMRMAVAAPLLLLAARSGGWTGPGNPTFLATGSCMAAYQLCFFSAVPRAGVAVTALLAICTAPLMIAILAALFLHEPLNARLLLALAAGVAGTALLVGGTSAHTSRQLLLGAVLALGAGLAYSSYAVITKRALRSASPLPLAALTFSVAALALLPVFLLQRPSPATFSSGWPLFLYIGAIPTALAYALYTTGLRLTRAAVAGIVGLLEPLTATALGIVVFGERFAPLGALGAVLLLFSLLLVLLPSGARQLPAHSSPR